MIFLLPARYVSSLKGNGFYLITWRKDLYIERAHTPSARPAECRCRILDFARIQHAQVWCVWATRQCFKWRNPSATLWTRRGGHWVTRDLEIFLRKRFGAPEFVSITGVEIVFSWAKVVCVALKFEVVSFNTWIHVFNDLGSRWNTDVVVSLVSIWGCKECIFQISHACFGKKDILCIEDSLSFRSSVRELYHQIRYCTYLCLVVG